MATASRQQNYISEVRYNAEKLWEAYLALLAAQNEWTAQDFANTLDDGVGANVEITAASVGSIVFNTANAMQVVMSAGHATNITAVLS